MKKFTVTAMWGEQSAVSSSNAHLLLVTENIARFHFSHWRKRNGHNCAFGYGGTCLPRQLPLWLWWEIVFLPLFTSELCRGGHGGPCYQHINSSCNVLSELCLVCVSVSPSRVMIQGLLWSRQSDTESQPGCSHAQRSLQPRALWLSYLSSTLHGPPLSHTFGSSVPPPPPFVVILFAWWYEPFPAWSGFNSFIGVSGSGVLEQMAPMSTSVRALFDTYLMLNLSHACFVMSLSSII